LRITLGEEWYGDQIEEGMRCPPVQVLEEHLPQFPRTSIAARDYEANSNRIIIYGARFSRIAPRWYTWIFVACDITSIVIQS
jgi:hypothetical protein